MNILSLILIISSFISMMKATPMPNEFVTRHKRQIQSGSFVFPGPARRAAASKSVPGINDVNRQVQTTSTSTTSTTQSPNEEMALCLRTCPVTPEHNPICGSDGVQYTNPGRLNCAAYCTRTAIQISHHGRCSS